MVKPKSMECSDLRACPFCHLKNAWLKKEKVVSIFAWTVRCACGASIGMHDSRRGAIAAWNGEYGQKRTEEGER